MLATSAFSRGLATRSETVETQNETASETIFGLISISEAFYNTRVKVGGFPHKTAIRYDGLSTDVTSSFFHVTRFFDITVRE